MQTAIDTAFRYKGRVISYALSAGLPAFTAVIMAAEITTTKVWIIAVASGIAAAATSLKALFDQHVDTGNPSQS